MFWPNHWNGVKGFGTKPPTDTVTEAFWVWRRPISTQFRAKRGDAEGVLVGLAGQTDQEVELHPTPALREGRFDGPVEILVSDQLLMTWRIRHVPASGAKVKPVRRARWIWPAMPTVNASTRRLGSETATRSVTPSCPASTAPATTSWIPREVGRRQRRQSDLVVAGAAQAVLDHRSDLFGRALSHRSRDHARLTEATPPRAPPEHLDVQPIVHHLAQRYELVLGVRPVGQVGDRALLDDLRRRRIDRARDR